MREWICIPLWFLIGWTMPLHSWIQISFLLHTCMMEWMCIPGRFLIVGLMTLHSRIHIFVELQTSMREWVCIPGEIHPLYAGLCGAYHVCRDTFPPNFLQCTRPKLFTLFIIYFLFNELVTTSCSGLTTWCSMWNWTGNRGYLSNSYNNSYNS